MKPVTHVLLLATGLMGSVSIAVAVQDNITASHAAEEKGGQVETWFDALGIKDRALKTRSVDRFAYTGVSQGDADSDFLERAFKTRAVRRDHVQDSDNLSDAWAFCLPEDWGGQSKSVTADNDLALNMSLPQHPGLRC